MSPVTPRILVAALLAAFAAGAGAQNVVKLGVARYTTDSKTNGITGIGVPPGADAETGDATTLLVVYERMFTPNLGVELALGVPPKIDAQARGSVAFLGKVLSAKVVAPTLLVNYHFGAEGDRFRPYVGAGINYTRFTGIESTIATSVEMSDSTGLALSAGIDYSFGRQWGLFGSVTRINTHSDLVAVSGTVLSTHIDFRPIVYTLGVSYRF